MVNTEIIFMMSKKMMTHSGARVELPHQGGQGHLVQSKTIFPCSLDVEI